MSDQANDLRRLARHAAHAVAAPITRPGLIVVTGGKGGVGTTSVALALAASLGREGRRTLLVDADPRGGDATILAGVEERAGLADVFAGRRALKDTLYAGPGGIAILPGVGHADPLEDASTAAADRLLASLAAAELPHDRIVLDAGNSPTPMAQRLRQAGDLVLVVATPEPAAMVGAFAVIKWLAREGNPASLRVLVSAARSARAAEAAHRRLARAAWRLLGLALPSAGYVLREQSFRLPLAFFDTHVLTTPSLSPSNLGETARTIQPSFVVGR